MFNMITNLHNKTKNYITDKKTTQALPFKGLISGSKTTNAKVSRTLKSHRRNDSDQS
jgi:hypothetical protein